MAYPKISSKLYVVSHIAGVVEQLLAANERLHQLDLKQAADAAAMSEHQRVTAVLAAAVACAEVEAKAAAAAAAHRDSELAADMHRAAAGALALAQQVHGLEAQVLQAAARGAEASTSAASVATVDIMSRLQVSLICCVCFT